MWLLSAKYLCLLILCRPRHIRIKCTTTSLYIYGLVSCGGFFEKFCILQPFHGKEEYFYSISSKSTFRIQICVWSFKHCGGESTGPTKWTLFLVHNLKLHEYKMLQCALLDVCCCVSQFKCAISTSPFRVQCIMAVQAVAFNRISGLWCIKWNTVFRVVCSTQVHHSEDEYGAQRARSSQCNE